ncbi:MAG: lipopolysaccharide biosynthesis [Silicimonas sp.]|nr:lipopolysaccharide biosynthesis [Silicimonas sp.]
MNSDIKFYLALLIKRLPMMLVMLLVGAGIGVGLALTMPPTYKANARLLVESAQISDQMVISTVQTSTDKQLQIIEQRLMTRANMIDVANKYEIFEDTSEMSPDDVFRLMGQRTAINVVAGDRQRATIMTIAFESEDPRIAANVVNEFVTLVESASAVIRQEEATETAAFFESEVARLSEQLSRLSADIVAFKEANKDALPEEQAYRLERQTALQERMSAMVRDRVARLEQRNRLLAVGTAGGVQSVQMTPRQQQLANLESQLASELSTLSENHPRVKRRRAQIAQIASTIAPGTNGGSADPLKNMLDLQIADIDGQIEFLEQDIKRTEEQLDGLRDAIERTPEVAIRLEALNRDYQNIQNQYDRAVTSLATAKVGESVELQNRGERVSVIERAVPPNRPSGPNRKLIAGGGVLAGSALAALFFVLTELLNRSIRRPIDLTRGLGVQPLATIPYLESDTVVQRRRRWHGLLILAAIIAVPLAFWAVHTFYLPLDLLAERLLDQMGL